MKHTGDEDTLDGADVHDLAPEPEDEKEATQRPAARKKRAPKKKPNAEAQ